MRTVLKSAVMATMLAATVAGSMTTADAQYGRRNNGGAVAAGVIGGLAAGAIIGGAVANSRPAYAAPAPYGAYRPVSGYAAYDGYSARGPIACPGGYWARRPVAYDAYGRPIRFSRPRYFCP